MVTSKLESAEDTVERLKLLQVIVITPLYLIKSNEAQGQVTVPTGGCYQLICLC